MRAFFDRLDSCSACDIPIFIGTLIVCVGLTIWTMRHDRRAKRNFFRAQAKAQEAFEKLGREDVTTQLAVMEALHCWRVWQHRPPADIVGTEPNEVEWHALSLMQSLPEEDRRQLRVM